jgi:hypothetical protein
MRTTTLLLLLLGAGCGGEPTCDREACEDLCVAQAGGNTFDATSRRLLTADEARRLRTEIDALRTGARLDAARSGVCAGAQGCDTLLGRDVTLAAGTYHVHVPYTLPARALPGFWTFSLYTSCVDADEKGSFEHAEEQLSTFRRPITEPSGAVDVPAFEIGPDAPARICAWRAFLRADRAQDRVVEGRWRTTAATVAPAEPDHGAPPEPAPDEAPADEVPPEDPGALVP